MNRKMTPILLSAALALGLFTYMTEKSSSGPQIVTTQSSSLLQLDPADILGIRVKRDYWNSYALKRAGDSTWQMTEPSSEPASPATVERLIAILQDLPILRVIDLPADDSEHHRQYGLWQPSMELTITTSQRERIFVFGIPTPDASGMYCAEVGRDGVYVTTAEAAKTIGADPATYRQGAASQSTSGLQIQDLTVGTGSPITQGQTANVNYTGRLADGTVFDSSSKQGGPFTFKLGEGKVIRGWDQGLVGMRVGGKRRLVIPPALAYGPKGHPPAIPPDATLTFENELLSIQGAIPAP